MKGAKKRVLRTAEAPRLKFPRVACDIPLHKRLDLKPGLKCLNKFHAILFIGKAGSGKSSCQHALMTSDEVFCQVFDNVELFMPETSKASFANSCYECLDSSKIHSELTPDELMDLYDRIETERVGTKEKPKKEKDKETTLVVFDDVQQDMKGPCEYWLKKMVNNRRHLRLSMHMMVQSYKEMPPKLRKALTDVFIFEISPEDLEVLRKEILHISKEEMAEIMRLFLRFKAEQNPKAFLFFNTETNKAFIDWHPCVEEGEPSDD